MRSFIILGCLVVVSSAVDLGYNYGPGISSGTVDENGGVGGGLVGGGEILGSGGRVGIGGLALTGGFGGNGGYVGSSSNLVGSSRILGGGGVFGGVGGIGRSEIIGTGGGIGGGGLLRGVGAGGIGSGRVLSNLAGGSLGGGLIGGAGGGVLTSGGIRELGLDALDSIPQTVEYSKQFFYFSAPEELQDEGVTTQQFSNVLKKNLQVAFIKAPENNAATNAALQLAKQAIEQRTAIYVLTKENDAGQVVGQLQEIQENVPTTPEVRFIKYRTPEDLITARETIQSQYDNFGGPSHVIDGGVVPVLNYASGGSAGSGTTLGGAGKLFGTGLGSSGDQIAGVRGIGGDNYAENAIIGAGATPVAQYVSGGYTGSGTSPIAKHSSGGKTGVTSVLNYASGEHTGGGTSSGVNYASGEKSTKYLPPSLKKK